MTQTPTIRSDFQRYADLITPLLSRTDVPTFHVEGLTAIQVERGLVFPRVLVNRTVPTEPFVNRLIESTRSETISTIAIVDRAEHHRPVYRGLLIYSWLQAYRLVYEVLPRSDFGRWEEALRAWCDLLESEMTQNNWSTDGMPASRGAFASDSIWMALALHVAGKVFVRDAWTDLAADAFGRLVRGQNGGAFLTATSSDNPDTHWYHELVLLHAVASYAVQAEDRTIAAAVRKTTEFHQNHNQPDHATTQPWSMFALIWNPDTRPLADQVLHAVSMQSPETLDGVSLMLLADCLYCLKLFL